MSIREKYAQQKAVASPLSSQIQAAEEEMQFGGGVNWLTCEEGLNDFRFFPSTEEGVAFMQLKHTHRLPIEIENEDGTKEIKERKPVFNSRKHGGTKKDIIDEYIDFLEKRETDRLGELKLSKKEFGAQIKAVMKPVNDWQKGIRPEFRWTGYAAKLTWNDDGSLAKKDKGVFDFSFSVGKKADGLAASQDRRGKVAETNPYTSIDKGAILVIDYDKKRDPAEMYRVSLDTDAPIAWDDEDLEWLEAQRSLAEQYIGSYRRLDFNMAIEGLTRFDTRNQFGVMSDPEFKKIIDEISAYYPEDVNEPMIIHPGSDAERRKQEGKDPFKGADASKKEEAPKKEAVKEAPKEEASTSRRRSSEPPAEEAEVGDQLDTMDRSQLLGYIQMNKLDIQVTTDHSEAMIRDFIRTEESLLEQEHDQVEDEEKAGGMTIEETASEEDQATEEIPTTSRRRGGANRDKIAGSF